MWIFKATSIYQPLPKSIQDLKNNIKRENTNRNSCKKFSNRCSFIHSAEDDHIEGKKLYTLETKRHGDLS